VKFSVNKKFIKFRGRKGKRVPHFNVECQARFRFSLSHHHFVLHVQLQGSSFEDRCCSTTATPEAVEGSMIPTITAR